MLNDKLQSPTVAEAGRKGGLTRAKNLTPEQRKEIARQGAKARWAKRGSTKKGNDDPR